MHLRISVSMGEERQPSHHSWEQTQERVLKTTTTTGTINAAVTDTKSVTNSDQQQYKASPIAQRNELQKQHEQPNVREFQELEPLLKQSPAELKSRHLRFPSVEDRVKVYLSNWYTPPCPGNEQALARYMYVDNENKPATTTTSRVLFRELPHKHPEPVLVNDYGEMRAFNISHDFISARALHIDRNTILKCEQEYCVDTIQYYVPAVDRVDANRADTTTKKLPIPTLAMFGDSDSPKAFTPSQAVGNFPQVPLNMKFRFRFENETAIHDMTSQECVEGIRPMHKTIDLPTAAKGVSYYQPIVWRLTSHRHYGMMEEIPDADIPWSKKKDMAVWRGGLTGIFRDGFKLGMLKSKTSREICMLMHRCKLVLMNGNSKLVDAKMTESEKAKKFVPDLIDQIPMYGKKMSYRDMLGYKAIVMLEGNDISSGFKWALYSESVVMTQRPTKTSWALEELLQPWVHYVPLNDDLTDVEEKMQWVLDHDEEAQDIARRGSLWVQDLLFHPDVVKDDENIYDDMIRRYRAHFVEDRGLVEYALEYKKKEENMAKVKEKKHGKNQKKYEHEASE